MKRLRLLSFPLLLTNKKHAWRQFPWLVLNEEHDEVGDHRSHVDATTQFEYDIKNYV